MERGRIRRIRRKGRQGKGLTKRKGQEGTRGRIRRIRRKGQTRKRINEKKRRRSGKEEG